MNKQESKRMINFEQIIAGSLLKFKKLDNVDIHLIIEDLTKINTFDIYSSYNGFDQLGEYIYMYRNGCITLRDNITLSDWIEANNCTIKEKFKKFIDVDLEKFFADFDIEQFKIRKEQFLKEQKELVLKESNVLLISDIQEDYDELVKYGFQNVDYFKSIIRADRYFQQNESELDKYHIIITGHQSVTQCCFEGRVELENQIRRIEDKKEAIVMPLQVYDFLDHVVYVSFLKDYKSWRAWHEKEKSYSKLFDKLIECASINQVIAKVPNKKFVPIKDYVNPNRLKLPTKKSDLKILYLDLISVRPYAEEIASKLGLNITFKEDNNFSLGRYVKNHLGDYDIIIVSDSYSNAILGMGNESTEQCKDTGRDLTLLVTYNDDINYISSLDENGKNHSQEIGWEMNLRYIFGGNIAKNSKIQSKKYRVLGQNLESGEKENYQGLDFQSIIEESVHLFQNMLLENNYSALSDFDFKTGDEYDVEYEKAITKLEEVNRKLEEVKKQALKEIYDFDSLRYSLISYLEYRKQGLVPGRIEGIDIIDKNREIVVYNIYNGRALCAMTIPKKKISDNLRVFEVQTMTKKGYLGEPKSIGLYTYQFDKFNSVPNKPDEKEAKAIQSIYKKVNFVIKPLNEEACCKRLERNIYGRPRTLNRRKRRRKNHSNKKIGN